MEVVCRIVDDNRVSSVIAACSTTAEMGSLCENIDKLAFAFIAPLGAENEGYGHDGLYGLVGAERVGRAASQSGCMGLK